MSNDVTFEELEKTALQFALAEFQGNISAGHFSSAAAINENSMKKAIEWHSAKTKRLEIFYSNPTNRADWKKRQNAKIIMPDIENDDLRLVKDQIYWVVPAIKGRGAIYAKFIGYDGLIAEFMNTDDSQDYFAVEEIKIN
ncbi:hypothetical protein ACTXGK_10750 [Psychrobacter sp. T6-5]|uniref:hypothetical protein n=1 Tax=Psychrobacter sp. T6-5 TaxID=3457451 RepID=UPI003FD2A850